MQSAEGQRRASKGIVGAAKAGSASTGRWRPRRPVHRSRSDAIFVLCFRFAPGHAMNTTPRKFDMSRRQLIKAAAATGAAGLVPGLQSAVYAAGSDKPEKEEVRIGFIPLTDCASVVMASVLGFDKKYGVKIIPTKDASWAGARDKLD